VTVRVALDARTLQGEPIGGVGRSTLGHLRNLRDRVAFTLLTDDRLPPLEPTRHLGLPQVALRGPISGRGATWLQVAAPRFLRGFDGIFHCPFYGLPFRQPVPMVATVHDITFEQHRDWFARERGMALRVQARCAARRAARILTPSEWTRQEVIAHYGLDEDRVLTAWNLLDPVYRDPPPPPPPAVATLASRYVVAMGGAWRRGIDLLLDAWPTILAGAPDLSLVLVGHDAGPLPQRVHDLGALTDDEWRGALAGAELFCYPTRHEGFGYPALEAAALGVPVVASTVGALPEVLGDAARWIASLDPQAVAEAVLDVLGDDARRASLAVAGRARSRAFDDATISDQVLRAYEAAAGT
jgi:glycosyltransferase involved in cell wall biosynthesis